MSQSNDSWFNKRIFVLERAIRRSGKLNKRSSKMNENSEKEEKDPNFQKPFLLASFVGQ
jgi:hypothetical protein